MAKRKVRHRLTTEEFISRARKVHGDKFDYFKADYKNSATKLTITCKIHGDFVQAPHNHLSGTGCKGCQYDEKRKGVAQFIKEAKVIHGEYYDYSKVTKYKSAYDKVTLICPIHKEFEITPTSHINQRSGCYHCGIKIRQKKQSIGTDKFIHLSKEIFSDRFDYSLVNYQNKNKKVLIICKEHGVFKQSPQEHTTGKVGCKPCHLGKRADSQRKTTEEFIEEAQLVHGKDTYDYSKVVYTNANDKVIIICPKHGDFNQVAQTHLSGHGCEECSYELRAELSSHTTEDFIKVANEVHGDLYDYSLVDYKSSKDKVTIICDTHGEFLQIAANHLTGSECPTCQSIRRSKGEDKILRFLVDNNIEYESQKTFLGCRHKKELRYDFYIPSANMVIEFHGMQHYKAIEFFGGDEGFEYIQMLDNIKRTYCRDNGIPYVEISYLERKRVYNILKEILLYNTHVKT